MKIIKINTMPNGTVYPLRPEDCGIKDLEIEVLETESGNEILKEKFLFFLEQQRPKWVSYWQNFTMEKLVFPL